MTNRENIIKVLGMLLIATVLTLLTGGLKFNVRLGLTNLLYTVVYWEGSWRITGYFRDRFNTYAGTRKRILYQFLTITGYVLITNFLILILITEFIFPHIEMSFSLYGGNLLISLFVTYLISSIYEAQCFFDLWKEALQETARMKEETLKAQFETLKNQVNPHFLFNSLNTLSAIIPEDPDKAIDFVQKLSQLYRYLLQHRDKDTIDLQTELESIESYLFLQAMRFGEKLKWEVKVSDALLNSQLPPLSLQLLVENAVKHNIISEGNPLTIKIRDEGGRLIICNTFQPKRSVEPSTQVGLNNLRERYRLLGQPDIQVKQESDKFEVSIPLIKKS